MPTKQSPGGSIFPYYFKDGELFGMHLGSFFKDEAGCLKRMLDEEQFIRAENYPLPLWIDFYQTKLSDNLMVEFSKCVLRLQAYIPKLALVGCSWRDRMRFRKLVRNNRFHFPMPLRFFSDPEQAKTWLVSEEFRE
jgi:hypothetical protein